MFLLWSCFFFFFPSICTAGHKEGREMELVFLYFSLLLCDYFSVSAAAAAKSLQSCLTLRNPMDCSPLGSSIHGIFQASILEWGAIAFSFLFLHSNNFECSFVLNFHIREIISYCWEGDLRKLLCINYGLKLSGLHDNPL